MSIYALYSFKVDLSTKNYVLFHSKIKQSSILIQIKQNSILIDMCLVILFTLNLIERKCDICNFILKFPATVFSFQPRTNRIMRSLYFQMATLRELSMASLQRWVRRRDRLTESLVFYYGDVSFVVQCHRALYQPAEKFTEKSRVSDDYYYLR